MMEHHAFGIGQFRAFFLISSILSMVETVDICIDSFLSWKQLKVDYTFVYVDAFGEVDLFQFKKDSIIQFVCVIELLYVQVNGWIRYVKLL